MGLEWEIRLRRKYFLPKSGPFMAWHGVEQLFPASSQAPTIGQWASAWRSSGPGEFLDVTQANGAISSQCALFPPNQKANF